MSGQFARDPHDPSAHEGECPRAGGDPAGTACTCPTPADKAESVGLTTGDVETLDAILVALWQCETEAGFHHAATKVLTKVEQIIDARDDRIRDLRRGLREAIHELTETRSFIWVETRHQSTTTHLNGVIERLTETYGGETGD